MIAWIKRRSTVVFMILGTVALSGTAYWYWHYRAVRIYEFDSVRDKQVILNMFDRDWYWLIPYDRTTFSPELMLTLRAPQQNPLYAGRLTIKVLRAGEKFIGFVAYYMKTPEVGFLNFLGVEPEFRSKGYAAQMLHYAIDDMVSRGARIIKLVTRPSNMPARTVYKKLGFREVREDETFVYLERAL